MTPRDDRYRAVGRILRPHGVHGELLVDVRTDSPEERFVEGASLHATLPGGAARVLTVVAARPHSGRLLITFDGVLDRDAAGELRGAVLTVDTSALAPSEDPEEFYDHQLEGLAVVTVGGELIGTVGEVLHGPGGELLAVRRTGTDELLVPFVREIVPDVDLTVGRLVIDPPEGLLDP
ncbi:MAG: ribosome maturation factor RimM [Sciscionella sp.]